MTEHERDGELVESVAPGDPLRRIFANAIAAIFSTFNEPLCKFAIQELVEAERRTRERLARRILN